MMQLTYASQVVSALYCGPSSSLVLVIAVVQSVCSYMSRWHGKRSKQVTRSKRI